MEATCEIWLHLAQWFQRKIRLKVWTDDGGCLSYKSKSVFMTLGYSKSVIKIVQHYIKQNDQLQHYHSKLNMSIISKNSCKCSKTYSMIGVLMKFRATA